MALRGVRLCKLSSERAYLRTLTFSLLSLRITS